MNVHFFCGRTACLVETSDSTSNVQLHAQVFLRKTLNPYQRPSRPSLTSDFPVLYCPFQNDQQFPSCVSVSPVAYQNSMLSTKRRMHRTIFSSSSPMYQWSLSRDRNMAPLTGQLWYWQNTSIDYENRLCLTYCVWHSMKNRGRQTAASKATPLIS